MRPIDVSHRLHDGPLQALTAARLQLDTVATRSDIVPSELAPMLDAARDAVVSASDQCRALIDELEGADSGA